MHTTLLTSKLYCFKRDVIYILFVYSKSPLAFSVTLFSTIKLADVQTVFHFSDYPIIPSCIFEAYGKCVNFVKDEIVTKVQFPVFTCLSFVSWEFIK